MTMNDIIGHAIAHIEAEIEDEGTPTRDWPQRAWWRFGDRFGLGASDQSEFVRTYTAFLFARRFDLDTDDILDFCDRHDVDPSDLGGTPHPCDTVRKVYVSCGPDDECELLSCVDTDDA